MKPIHHKNQKQKSLFSISKLKKKQRDCKRALLKCKDAGKKRELERMIQTIQTDINDTLEQEKHSLLAEKYKYIKFVEEKKVKRRLQAAVKEQNLELIQKFQFYLKYIQFYPKDVKYLSLFPNTATTTCTLQQDIFSKLKTMDHLLTPGFTWTFHTLPDLTETKEEEKETDDFFL
jgi:hypothetical protein